MDIIPQKRCSVCKQPYPATKEFFGVHVKHLDGLRSECRNCQRIRNKQWKIDNPDKVKLSGKRYRIDNREKKRVTDKKWREENSDKWKEYSRKSTSRWREKHPERNKASKKRYYLNNADVISAKSRQRYWDDPDKNRIKSKLYRENNRDELKEKNKIWRIKHPDNVRINNQRRTARKRDLPSTLTEQNWQHALAHFHGCCAYCSNPPSLFDLHTILHQEHHKPLSKGGGYTPDNILPACQSCNLSKRAKSPEIWLIERFGKRKAKVILKRIQDYFASIF